MRRMFVYLAAISALIGASAVESLAGVVDGYVRLNQKYFYSHQPMVAELWFSDPSIAETANVYVALQAGDTFLFYPHFTDVAIPVDLGPKGDTLASDYFEGDILISAKFGRIDTPGQYHWHVAAFDDAGTLLTHNVTTFNLQAGPDADELALNERPLLPPTFQYSRPTLSVQPAALQLVPYFQRGTFSTNPNFEDEAPFRYIGVDRFYIQRTEVTNAEYAAFIADGGYTQQWRNVWSEQGWSYISDPANPISAPNQWNQAPRYHMGETSPNHPVSGVSYYEAEAYARWRGRRLPTEAEWELAATGLNQSTAYVYPWGETLLCDRVNVWSCGGREKVEVTSFPNGASPLGALNMAGNVWEWTSDFYQPGYYEPLNNNGYNSPDENPIGVTKPPSGNAQGFRLRTWRGGSFWFGTGGDAEEPFAPQRNQNRYPARENNRYLYVGFRTARTLLD